MCATLCREGHASKSTLHSIKLIVTTSQSSPVVSSPPILSCLWTHRLIASRQWAPLVRPCSDLVIVIIVIVIIIVVIVVAHGVFLFHGKDLIDVVLMWI